MNETSSVGQSMSAQPLVLSGFWRRFGAFFFDLFIVSWLFLFATTPLGLISHKVEGNLTVVVMLLYFVYLFLRDAQYWGRSLGKRVFGIKTVVVENGQARPCGFKESIARNIVLIVPILWFVEAVLIAVQRDKQRLGDLLAHTKVVKNS